MRVLSSKIVKNQKVYKCFGCCRKSPQNDSMEVAAIADQGEIWTTRICMICVKFLEKNYLYEFWEGDLPEHHGFQELEGRILQSSPKLYIFTLEEV